MKILFVLLWILLGCVGLYFFIPLLFSFFVNPRKEYDKDSKLYRFLLNIASVIALKFMRVKIHISGAEKLPKDKKLLFVCNHRSNFDPIITWCAFKKHKLAFISKKGNFKIPIFGQIIRKCCFMAIDRESPKKAIATINRASELLKNGEVSVGVYPEGKRSKDGTLLEFHSGVFRIAQKAQSPIVVLSLQGTERIHKSYPFHTSHVYLDVLEVIPTEEVVASRSVELCERAKTIIENNLSVG